MLLISVYLSIISFKPTCSHTVIPSYFYYALQSKSLPDEIEFCTYYETHLVLLSSKVIQQVTLKNALSINLCTVCVCMNKVHGKLYYCQICTNQYQV